MTPKYWPPWNFYSPTWWWITSAVLMAVWIGAVVALCFLAAA